MSSEPDLPPSSFFIRHEFAIRRLHSLTGIVPLGAYMVVHLATNATLLNGTPTFQRAVYAIHALGRALPIVEWGFILLPLLFHAVIGVWIVRSGRSNSHQYKFTQNRRYTWQRVTGLIAFVFLLMHVWHLHGWFHFHPWVEMGGRLGFVQFRAYNAASTLALAMDGYFWPAFYLVGVWACVYHLANGLWTAGITWGFWISAAAQRRATILCTAFGIVLLLIGTGAWWASISIDPVAARAIEDQMYEVNMQAGIVPESVEKRAQPDRVLAPELIPQEPIPKERAVEPATLQVPGDAGR